MRIGILLPGFSQSDTDWAIPVQQHLVRELTRGNQIRVIPLRYPHHHRPYRVAEAEVHPLGAAQTRGPGRLLLWARALITIQRLHRDRPFDVLHAMWADETGLIAGWAGRWLNVPVVVSVAGGELVNLPDIHYGLQRGAFSRWVVGRALQMATRVTAASRHTMGLIHHSAYPISDEHIVYLPLGVDANLFRPDPSVQRHWRHLVHAASLTPVKDQATLLRALARLQDDITLELVGEGPERTRLQRQAITLGIEQRVTFTGAVHHPGMPSHFHRAGLHVLTSRHEGQGMVTLEAAACGLCTVGTAVGLLPDDPQLGRAVPVGDDAGLAQNIEKLLDNPQQLAEAGQRAREAIEHHYRVEQTVDRLRRLYEDVAPGAAD